MSAIRRRAPARLVQIGAITAGLVVVACSGGSSPSPAGGSGAPSTVASGAPSGSASAGTSAEASGGASASASGDVGELTIQAEDYKFDLPATVPGGAVNITLTNEGKEEHQAQFARLAEGKTFEDLVGALQAQDDAAAFGMVTFSGGPTGVAPGEEQQVGTDLEPGNYALLCFVAGADGVPHFAKGMVSQLEVTEAEGTAELPAGDEEITLQDFAFLVDGPLPTGEQVVTVTNNGPQPHEATVVKLNEGTTAEQIRTMMTSGEVPAGPPPWTSAGGIAAIAANTEATITLDLEAGDYALICFVPDPASGKPHAQLGMVEALTVQ